MNLQRLKKAELIDLVGDAMSMASSLMSTLKDHNLGGFITSVEMGTVSENFPDLFQRQADAVNENFKGTDFEVEKRLNGWVWNYQEKTSTHFFRSPQQAIQDFFNNNIPD